MKYNVEIIIFLPSGEVFKFENISDFWEYDDELTFEYVSSVNDKTRYAIFQKKSIAGYAIEIVK